MNGRVLLGILSESIMYFRMCSMDSTSAAGVLTTVFSPYSLLAALLNLFSVSLISGLLVFLLISKREKEL